MKNWIIKYSLEIFSSAVLFFVMTVMLFFPEVSYIRKLGAVVCDFRRPARMCGEAGARRLL